MFNILTDELRYSYNNLEIETDFRCVLMYDRIVKNENLNENDKIIEIINLFFPTYDGSVPIQELFDNIKDFIHRGKEIEEGEDDESTPSFDFNVDNELIFSAFLQVYNIDLVEIEYLHWWKFLSLFNGLPEGNKLTWVIGKRLEKIPKQTKYNVSYINNLRKIKEAYSLKKTKKLTLGEQINDIMKMWS